MKRLIAAFLFSILPVLGCDTAADSSRTTAGTTGSGGASTSSGGSGGGSSTTSSGGTGGTATTSGGAGGMGGSGGMVGTGGAAMGGGGSGATGSGGSATFALTSSAFNEGDMIPGQYECMNDGGQNDSPPLDWTPGPAATKSYAIVMRDLDFNGSLHWVIWDIPANVTSLPEDVDHTYQPSVPAGAKQAPYNGSVTGYSGPCSQNINTYEFTVYAIDVSTLPGVDQTSTKQDAEQVILNHQIASTTLSGES